MGQDGLTRVLAVAAWVMTGAAVAFRLPDAVFEMAQTAAVITTVTVLNERKVTKRIDRAYTAMWALQLTRPRGDDPPTGPVPAAVPLQDRHPGPDERPLRTAV